MWELWHMPHMRAHRVIHGELLEDKFWTATPKKSPIFPPSVVWFEPHDSWTDYIISRRTVPPLRREGCHRRPPPQMAVLAARTCESFGPKLFIWLFLSATSVSSVHLCPFWKKKKSPPLHPKQHVPLGDTQLQHDHQQNRAKLTQRTPSTFHPPPPFFPQAVQKCTQIKR